MANGFAASLDDQFALYDDKFVSSLITQFTAIGSPATCAQGNGIVMAEGTGFHGGDKLRIDPLHVQSAEFCVSLDDTVNGDGGVQDGNAIWIGIQNGVYNTDPTTSTKSIFFRCSPVGSDSSVISIYAKDGITTYSFSTGKSFKTIPSKLGIYFGRGWKEVEIKIDGEPVLYNGNNLDLSGVASTDWFQPLVYMKAKASGPESNDLRCHHLRVLARNQRTATRPPTTAVPSAA